MMVKDNTRTVPIMNINWLSRWLAETDHDIPYILLKCVWCEECFLADSKLQAEIRTQLMSFGVMSAEIMLVKRYMEWHMNGHPENEDS